MNDNKKWRTWKVNANVGYRESLGDGIEVIEHAAYEALDEYRKELK